MFEGYCGRLCYPEAGPRMVLAMDEEEQEKRRRDRRRLLGLFVLAVMSVLALIWFLYGALAFP
jgi:hypothetical protein